MYNIHRHTDLTHLRRQMHHLIQDQYMQAPREERQDERMQGDEGMHSFDRIVGAHRTFCIQREDPLYAQF